MERDEIEDYINNLKRIEKGLSDDDSFDLKYIAELDTLLNKLRGDVSDVQGNLIENPEDAPLLFNLNVKIKKLHENAVIPSYAKKGDAGLDLVATEIISETPTQISYGTGIAVEIPLGYVGLVFPRSSIKKYDLELTNSVGVIDSGYRGEIQATFNKVNHQTTYYNVGDRIAQLIILPYPQIKFVQVDNLSDTERGSGGFGSTGT